MPGVFAGMIAGVAIVAFLILTDQDPFFVVTAVLSLPGRNSVAQSNVSTAPRSLYLRAGDAAHLSTAQDLGEQEIWTNDRHLLGAASHFGLEGRSV
jgi:predicted nucleic acid-binding protein